MRSTFAAILIISASLWFVGCANAPNQSAYNNAPSDSAEALETLDNTSPRYRAKLALSWAKQYSQEDNNKDALEILESIDRSDLDDKKKLQWYKLAAHAQMSEDKARQASILLDEPELKQLLSESSDHTRAEFQLLRADSLALDGKNQDSLALRFDIDPAHLDDDENEYNSQLTWELLNKLDKGELEQLADQSNNRGTGWAELALLTSSKQKRLEKQVNALHKWQREWEDHIATKFPPKAITQLEKALDKRPSHIAVLLPESGPLASAAIALRDGLMAGYYYAREQGEQSPELRFYDTAEQNIEDVYFKAVDEGAEYVVGPLDKDKVTELSELSDLPVNVLSLNYKHGEDQRDSFIQFGLAPEDEAQQVAALAYQEGYKDVGILYPSSASGQRTAYAFENTWRELGGRIADSIEYGKDPNEAVSRLLKVDRYQAKSNRKSNVSRKDMDVIFIVANPNQGRQIKPAIDFYHGEDFPLYSISMIYGAQENTRYDKDLNRIKFVEIPWIIEPEADLKEQVDANWEKGHGAYERIFALGVDAYDLSQQLALMESLPNSSISGLTGKLNLEDNRISRILIPAEFSGGRVVRDNVSEPDYDIADPAEFEEASD